MNAGLGQRPVVVVALTSVRVNSDSAGACVAFQRFVAFQTCKSLSLDMISPVRRRAFPSCRTRARERARVGRTTIMKPFTASVVMHGAFTAVR